MTWNDEQRQLVAERIENYWPGMNDSKIDALLEDLDGSPVLDLLEALKREYKNSSNNRFPGHKAMVASIKENLGILIGKNNVKSRRQQLLDRLGELARQHAKFRSGMTGIEYEILSEGLLLTSASAKKFNEGWKYEGVQRFSDMSDHQLDGIIAGSSPIFNPQQEEVPF